MFIRTLTLAAMLTATGLLLPDRAEATHPYRANVAGASARLHNAARILHQQVRGRSGFAHLEPETARMLQATERFMRTARATSDVPRLSYDFEQVSLELGFLCDSVEYALMHRRDLSVARYKDRVEQEFNQIYHALYGGHQHRSPALPTARSVGRSRLGGATAHGFSNSPYQLSNSRVQRQIPVGRPATSQRRVSQNMFLE